MAPEPLPLFTRRGVGEEVDKEVDVLRKVIILKVLRPGIPRVYAEFCLIRLVPGGI